MLKFKRKQQVLHSAKKNLITSFSPKSPISEQYRTIRTNIQFSMIDKELKTLACTSAMPKDGKSTTIANLAVTIAQQGQRILLVDADLRKPTVHQIMEVKNQYGLTSLLTKRTTPDIAIIPTPMANDLYILPSGPVPPNPSELLGSKMMEDLILELSNDYDLILFDTPPVLAVTDAQILGSRCDGVILVLRSHQTEKKDIVKAKELLDRTNVNVLGVVINLIDQKELNYGYYYAND